MTLFSFKFIVFVCVLVLAYHGSQGPVYRRVVFTLANTGFLLLVTVFDDPRNLIALLVFVCGGYVLLHTLQRKPSGAWPVALIVSAIVILAVVKRYDFLGLILPPAVFNHPFALVGISYITFKFIHVTVDLHQGQLAPLKFWTYVNYQLGFVSLFAGPIQRYNDFAEFWEGIGTEPASNVGGLQSWSRMLTGMLKLGVLAAVAWYLYQLGRTKLALAPGPALAAGSFLLLFYAYPAYVYLNFSGYCDVVIGCAGVLGLRHQENFDRPWKARNLLDFWNRWHISLTLWIRDYVFSPAYKAVAERFPARAGVLGYGLLFVALFLAGVWHGPTWNFVVFGVIHGVGVATVRWYGDRLRAILGRQGWKSYLAHAGARRIATAVTITYVSFSFLFFQPGVQATLQMLRDAWGKVW